MKTKENLKQNAAITIIALVITIIILLILATIAIVELRNTNLFSKTINARNKYKQSAEEENNTLDNYANKINEISKESNQILTPDEPIKEIKIDEIFIGQVVNYTPDETTGENPVDQSYTKRNNADSDYRIIGNNWQVMKKNENDDTITITTSDATTGTVLVYGKNGYNACNDYIDSLCRYYYSKKNITSDARSMNREADEDDYKNAKLNASNSFFLTPSLSSTNPNCSGYCYMYYFSIWKYDISQNKSTTDWLYRDGKYNFWSGEGYEEFSTSRPIRPVVTIPIKYINKIQDNIVYIK